MEPNRTYRPGDTMIHEGRRYRLDRTRVFQEIPIDDEYRRLKAAIKWTLASVPAAAYLWKLNDLWAAIADLGPIAKWIDLPALVVLGAFGVASVLAIGMAVGGWEDVWRQERRRGRRSGP